jgi:large subunit ribosomal protein L15
MKLHDLRPAEGSRTARTRVGRGIAAGKGKTAGRGTKGQKARAGGSIPPWFEGGQTPLHMRIPKLRGFKNRFKTEYEIVNVGDIARVIESGRLEVTETGRGKSKAPITVNQDLLRDAGLIRTLDKPMKVLGNGDLAVALFVVADAFTKSAREKIEAAGGSVNVLEVPTRKRPALGVETAEATPAESAPEPTETETEPEAPAKPRRGKASAAAAPEAAEAEATEAEPEPEPATVEASAPEPAEAEPEPEASAADAGADSDEAATTRSDEA